MKTLASLCLLLIPVCLLEAQHVPGFLHRHQHAFVNPYPPTTGYHWRGFMIDEVSVWKWNRFQEAWDSTCTDCGRFQFEYNDEGRVTYVREFGTEVEWVVKCSYDSLGRVLTEEKNYSGTETNQAEIRTTEYNEFAGQLETIEVNDDDDAMLISPARPNPLSGLLPGMRIDNYSLRYWENDAKQWGDDTEIIKGHEGGKKVTTFYRIRDNKRIPYQKITEEQLNTGRGYLRTQYVLRDKWIAYQKNKVEVTWIGNSVVEAIEYIAYCDTCKLNPWAKWQYRGRNTLMAPKTLGSLEREEGASKERAYSRSTQGDDDQLTRSPEELELAVSPTRASGNINITLPYVETGEFLIEIYRTNGVLFYNRRIGGAEAGNNVTVDLSTFPKGEYIIYIKSDSNTYSSKIIKI